MTTTVSEKRIKQDTINKPWAIIPAKASSQRLPHKNKLPINGKPLVQWTIDVAKEANLFGLIIVSSDDEEILEMAYESKGVVVHRRPSVLANQDAQIRHVCRFLLGLYGTPSFPTTPDCFCVLTPCNPFRTADELNKAYNLFLETDANYVMSVVRATPPPQISMFKTKKGWLCPWIGVEEFKQAQKLLPLYRHDASFIFAKTRVFGIEFDYKFYGSKNIPYFIERPSIDIDTPADYEYARYLLEVR